MAFEGPQGSFIIAPDEYQHQYATSELAALVQDLEHQLPLLEAKRAGAKLYGAPGLSLFDLIRPNENALSRIISDLLNPLGDHGQGNLFLNVLLASLDLPRVGVRDVVSVSCEVQTGARRRIDIVIETPAVVLGIENKPWAAQQHDQLRDYLLELKKRARGRRAVLVFLSDQEEKSAVGEVVRLPYYATQSRSLHGLLSSIVHVVRAPRARSHVEDFLRYINYEFGGPITMIEQEDEFYVEAVEAEFDRSPARKKALAVVMLAQSKLHARILNEIGFFLLREVRKVSGDFVASEVGLYDSISEKYGYWSLSRPTWPRNCHVCLSAEGRWFSKVYMGVRAPDPAKFPPEEACSARAGLNTLKKSVPGGKQTEGWPWWCYTRPSDWDFDFAARAVIESPTAEVEQYPLVQELGRCVVELAGAIESCL